MNVSILSTDQSNKYISPREKEVLGLIAEEFTTKEIASQLYISYETANTHRKNLLSKMDVKNTAGLIRKAFEVGIMKIHMPFSPNYGLQAQF
ncbi:MAG: DNA-binding CsgD family transcriptional regulator [Saprospiraceae bacterium]|jgi:DNA-binding CsgD family transcriptional regulator